jgi:hypothetical protein
MSGAVQFVSPTFRWLRARCHRTLWRSANARTAKPCGPGRRRYGQAFRGDLERPTGSTTSSIRGAREARRNSAPGRARHKPSNHCAGKAVCWASPVCCCAVSLRYNFAQRTAGASRHPAFPAPSWLEGGRSEAKLGRNQPRGREAVSTHPTRRIEIRDHSCECEIDPGRTKEICCVALLMGT